MIQCAADRIFLLSADDLKYLGEVEKRKCVPSNYAIARRAETSRNCFTNGKAACKWWLRSSGMYSGMFQYINYDGAVGFDGIGQCLEIAVRPALWINLNN